MTTMVRVSRTATALAVAVLATTAVPAGAVPPGNDPYGAYDLAASQPGQVRVAGWSFDPNVPTDPIVMHVYVGGTAGAPGAIGYGFTASAPPRPDVAAAYPGVGSNHGLDATFETPKRGAQPVCVYAINVGLGANVFLGCKTVTIADPNPLGSFDLAASQPGQVRVAGWGFDPNSPTGTLTVRAVVGDTEQHATTATGLRPDVGAAFPGVGDHHGFDTTFETPKRGVQPACIYAINDGPGADVFLGCKTVTIADPDPVGSFDLLRPAGVGKIRLRAWAFDPNDPTAPTTLRVYVGGRSGELHTFAAAAARPDLAKVYPEAGASHGLDATFDTAAQGDQAVCVYADNAGPGREVHLGCKTVHVEAPPIIIDPPEPAVSVSGKSRVADGTNDLRWKYRYTFEYQGDITRFTSMRFTFTGDTARTTVVVTCRGRGCRFARRTFTPRRGAVTLTAALARPLRSRSVITLKVRRAGRPIGKGVRLVTRRAADPVETRVKP